MQSGNRSKSRWLAVVASVLALGLSTACTTSSSKPARGSGGSAQVTFAEPREFTDFRGSGPSGQAERDRRLAELEDCIQTESARWLAADRKLEVKITDIDMAGGTSRGPQRIRVTGTSRDTAEMQVEYVLRDQAGTVLRSGSDRLLSSASNLASTSTSGSETSMPLLKQALRTWIKELGRY